MCGNLTSDCEWTYSLVVKFAHMHIHFTESRHVSIFSTLVTTFLFHYILVHIIFMLITMTPDMDVCLLAQCESFMFVTNIELWIFEHGLYLSAAGRHMRMSTTGAVTRRIYVSWNDDFSPRNWWALLSFETKIYGLV